MTENFDIKKKAWDWSKLNLVILFPLVIIFLIQAFFINTNIFVFRELVVGFKSVAESFKTPSPQKTLESLSKEFQERIEATQNRGCDGATLVCGHRNGCGFGTQIHSRIGCLIISLALNIPLIHNLTVWPYLEPWNEVFLPIGSNCSINNATFLKWDWKRRERDPRFGKFDLYKGFPLWKEMIQEIEKLHPNPFLWVVGQLLKYTLRPSETFKKKLEEWKKEIKFDEWKEDGGIFGIHVRRTDKASDGYRNSWHELPEYFLKAEESIGAKERKIGRRLFVTSDDNTIFPEAKKKYPWWDIRGFNSTKNHLNYHIRFYKQNGGKKGSGWEIYRDIFLLAECDIVVCGFTSNVCRLVLEMMAFKSDNDPTGRVKSLEIDYFYQFHEGRVELKLIPYEEVEDLERLINLTLTLKNNVNPKYLLFQ